MRDPHSETSSLAQRLVWAAALVPSIAGVASAYAALRATPIAATLWVALSWQLLALCFWVGLALLGLPVSIERARTSRRPVARCLAIVLVVHAGHVAAVAIATSMFRLGMTSSDVFHLIPTISAIYLPLDLLALAAMVGASATVAGARTRDRLEASVTTARQRALRSQLEPHFLYNALNSAAVLARRGDGRSAARMLTKLGDLLRYVLAGPGNEPLRDVTLSAELDFVSGYLDIESIRFGDRATFVVEAGPEVRRALVPPLVLQPLVENAIKHAIANREQTGGSLTVTARAADGLLHLEVIDNGGEVTAAPAPDARAVHDGMGLRLTRERLSLRYGDRAQLTVIPATTGTRSSIVLPLVYA
jgi:hypothetical protein